MATHQKPEAEIADYVARAEEAYAAMYDAAPHRVKDHYEDACVNLAQAIQHATALGLADEVARLQKRAQHITAVYNAQFRYVGR